MIRKGYLARSVRIQNHTYGNRPAREEQSEEWYELTQPECLKMTPKLAGKPIIHWHNMAEPYLEPQIWGNVVSAGFDQESGDWGVSFVLNDTGEAAYAAARATGKELCLSLNHNNVTLEPKEVSLTFKPAREGADVLATNDVRYNDPVFGKTYHF